MTEESSFIASYFPKYLNYIRTPIIQPFFIDLLFRSKGPAYRRELGTLATPPRTTKNGLTIHFGHGALDVFQSSAGKYAFHGTQVGWKILTAWKLIPQRSRSGPGIFFGRDYHSSYIYAAGRSLVANAMVEDPLKCVFVFRKDPDVHFEAMDQQMGTVREYRVFADANRWMFDEEYQKRALEGYSLDHLHAIIFLTSEDVETFDERLTGEQRRDFLARGITLYEDSYRPLSDDEVFERFSREFMARATAKAILDDPVLLMYPLGKPRFQVSADEYVSLLNLAEGFGREWTKQVLVAAGKSKDFGAILYAGEVLIKEADEWIDILLEGGWRRTLLAKLILDDFVTEEMFRRMVGMVANKEKMKEWLDNNQGDILEDMKDEDGERTEGGGLAEAKLRYLQRGGGVL
jgi:hypothetical protein